MGCDGEGQPGYLNVQLPYLSNSLLDQSEVRFKIALFLSDDGHYDGRIEKTRTSCRSTIKGGEDRLKHTCA